MARTPLNHNRRLLPRPIFAAFHTLPCSACTKGGKNMGVRSTWKSAMHSLASLVNPAFVVGFAAALAWMGTFYSVASAEYSASPLTSPVANDVYLISLAIGTVVDMALVLFPAPMLAIMRHRGHAVSALAMVFSTLLLVLASLPTINLPWVARCGAVLAGLASTLFLLCWGLGFGLMELRSMFPSLILAYIFMSASNVLFALSNQYTAIATALLLPLVSLACMVAGRHGQTSNAMYERCQIPQGSATVATNPGLPRVLLIKLGAAFLIWATVNRLLRGIYTGVASDAPLSQALMNGLATLIVALVIAGALALLALCPIRFRFEHAYRPFYLMALMGALLLPFACLGKDPFVGYALNTAGYHVFCMFMWVIIAACCHNYPERCLRIYGFVGSFWSIGAICGVLLAQALPPKPSSEATAMLVLVSVVALSLCYLFVFTEHDAGRLAQIIPVQRKRPFREKCANVAQSHKLSAREQEVMVLIAQGRDTAAIQERLALSASTVQTHRAHIYQKLGIHSKQELIDMIEAEDVSQ